jgi:hypothetical protein
LTQGFDIFLTFDDKDHLLSIKSIRYFWKPVQHRLYAMAPPYEPIRATLLSSFGMIGKIGPLQEVLFRGSYDLKQ